jgi:hypothetical protein
MLLYLLCLPVVVWSLMYSAFVHSLTVFPLSKYQNGLSLNIWHLKNQGLPQGQSVHKDDRLRSLLCYYHYFPWEQRHLILLLCFLYMLSLFCGPKSHSEDADWSLLFRSRLTNSQCFLCSAVYFMSRFKEQHTVAENFLIQNMSFDPSLIHQGVSALQ